MASSILRDSSKEFAKEIIFLCRKLRANHVEYSLIDQLLRCATSIGANLYEAQYAQSKKDFISKLEIAQKECHETEYWLEILFETNSIEDDEYKQLKNNCGTILKMLISSLNTIKSKQSQC